MTDKEYKRTTSKALTGRRGRLVVDLTMGGYLRVTLRAGHLVTITGKVGGGLEIETTPCQQCRTTYTMQAVPPRAVELLPVTLADVGAKSIGETGKPGP